MEESIGQKARGEYQQPEIRWKQSIMEESTEQQTAQGSILQRIRENFPGKRQDPKAYSPLALAYIGDALYDLIIRTVVVERANRPVRDLHRIAVKYVSAEAQAEVASALLDRLTEEEGAVYRRGRNSKPHTKAKNASMEDYLKATGFEAVLGYLYLTDNLERALELVRDGLAATGSVL